MPQSLTPAPTNAALIENKTIVTAGAWWTWFDLVRQYINGFSSLSDANQDIEPNVTYISTSAVPQVFTVPSRFDVNQTFQIIGTGAGGWVIQLGVGQFIRGDGTTTSGGSLASTNRYDTVTLKGSVLNTELSITSKVGTLTYA